MRRRIVCSERFDLLLNEAEQKMQMITDNKKTDVLTEINFFNTKNDIILNTSLKLESDNVNYYVKNEYF